MLVYLPFFKITFKNIYVLYMFNPPKKLNKERLEDKIRRNAKMLKGYKIYYVTETVKFLSVKHINIRNLI